MFTSALFAGIVTTILLGAVVRLRGEQPRMSRHAHHLVVRGNEPPARQLLDTILEVRPREALGYLCTQPRLELT